MATSFRLNNDTGLYAITKDPDAVLDYSVDWSTWLEGDTVSSIAWALDSGITKDSQELAAGVATAWISGGSVGIDYRVTCRIVTAGGRTDDRSFLLQVRER